MESGAETNLRPEDLDTSLSNERRRAVGALHPALMGGEYLPDYLPGEVEIARITMASITRDVTSIRARPVGRRIYFRVLDEHETEYGLRRKYALKPLTMKGLVRLMDGTSDPGNYTGLVVGFLDFSVENGGDLDDYLDFLTIGSDFYPELEEYYEERIGRWGRRVAKRC